MKSKMKSKMKIQGYVILVNGTILWASHSQQPFTTLEAAQKEIEEYHDSGDFDCENFLTIHPILIPVVQATGQFVAVFKTL